MKLLSAFLTLLCLQTAPAVASVTSLLENEYERPSVKQVMAAVPAGADLRSLGLETSIQVDKTHAAKLIAALDVLKPGTIAVPLGRDLVMAGDIIDAFFILRGEEGRVVRLNASGATIRGETPDRLVEFMKSSGLDFEAAARGEKSYMLIDNSSATGTSQMTSLLAAAHTELKKIGAPNDVRLRAVQATSVDEDAPGSWLKRHTPAGDHLRKLHELELKHGHPTSLVTAFTPAMNSLMYTSEWHSSFGKLERQADGRLLAKPVDASGAKDRAAALSEMATWIEAMRDPEMLPRVEVEARALGYEFHLKPLSCKSAVRKSL